MRAIEKKIAVLLLAVLILTFGSSISLADTQKHWAQDEIQYMREKSVISGYPDGSFKPDQSISRVEFIKIINNLMGYTEMGQVRFSDAKEGEWYYSEVAKAVAAKYIDGYEDNTIRPNNPITREEASKILVVAFGLENKGSNNTVDFTDNNQISNWAREYVNTLKNNGYISGYPDKSFRGNNPIARAEVVKIASNIANEIYNIEGQYSKNIVGNVLINAPGITLKDMEIKGDLYLTEGIGEKDITLDNVTITGTIFVRSKNSTLTIEKGSLIEKIKIQAKDIKIIVEGSVNSIVSNENYLLNNQAINKNADTSIKDGKIAGKDESKPSQVPKDDDDPWTPEIPKDDEDGPIPPKEEFTAKLNKGKYNLDEAITIFGKVIKDKVGLKNLDITLRVVDISGNETITVEQGKTDNNGEFNFTFKLPEETSAGKYKVIVKANDPINKTLEINFEIIEDEYKLNVLTNKVEYTIDEDIIISGTALKGSARLNNVDITLKIVDKNQTQTMVVEQVKTDDNGEFLITLKLPEGTAVGDYKIVVKANNPVEKVKEIEITVK